MVHTTHPEAAARQRSYIRTARNELREEARRKLHRKLIEAYGRPGGGTKRTLEESGPGQEQPCKKVRVSEAYSDIQALSSDRELRDAFPLGQSVPRDPFAAPMFPSGNVSVDDGFPDPFAPRLYRFENDYLEPVAGGNGFMPFP